MAGLYEVRLRDTAAGLQGRFSNFRSLDYTLRLGGVDDITIVLDDRPATAYGVPVRIGAPTDAALAETVGLDWLWEVWRADPAAVPAMPWYRDADGLDRAPLREVQADNTALYTAHAVGHNDLLARRGIWYPAGSAGADKSGPGETVILAYVDENAGPGALAAAGRAADGVTPGLTCAPDAGRGDPWTGSRAYMGLLDTVQEIAVATGLEYGVLRPDPALPAFRFKCQPIWGLDRTTQGIDLATGLNGAGNVPVVFSLDHANIAVPAYALNRTAEVTAVLVLGQGLGAARATTEVTDAVAAAASPWNRREAVRSASQEATAAGLTAVGAAALEALAARESFSFQVLQTAVCLYGRDYGLGDLVTARFAGREMHYRVTEVHVHVAGSAETIAIKVANLA